MNFTWQAGSSRSAMFGEIWNVYERGGTIVRCAWCGQILLAESWVRPPLDALAAIDERLATSHSICPSCLSQQLGGAPPPPDRGGPCVD